MAVVTQVRILVAALFELLIASLTCYAILASSGDKKGEFEMLQLVFRTMLGKILKGVGNVCAQTYNESMMSKI